MDPLVAVLTRIAVALEGQLVLSQRAFDLTEGRFKAQDELSRRALSLEEKAVAQQAAAHIASEEAMAQVRDLAAKHMDALKRAVPPREPWES